MKIQIQIQRIDSEPGSAFIEHTDGLLNKQPADQEPYESKIQIHNAVPFARS